ncbi:unnamed protein product, partial [marine sediment metagenome]
MELPGPPDVKIKTVSKSFITSTSLIRRAAIME